MSLRIEPYSIDSAAEVQDLADNALGAGYFDVAKMTQESGLVAVSGSSVVGFVLFEPDDQRMSLTTIVVDLKWQRQGIGLLLGSAALAKHADKVWTSPAWICGSDIPADRLLRRLGFEPSHRVQEYWFDDSRKRGYACPDCGNPCQCDAMIYRHATA